MDQNHTPLRLNSFNFELSELSAYQYFIIIIVLTLCGFVFTMSVIRLYNFTVLPIFIGISTYIAMITVGFIMLNKYEEASTLMKKIYIVCIVLMIVFLLYVMIYANS